MFAFSPPVNHTVATPSIMLPPSNMSVEEGATISLPCGTDGDDASSTITVVWLKDSKPLLFSSHDGDGVEHKVAPPKSHDHHKMAPSGSLQIFNVRMVDAGLYTCVATNSGGSVSATAFIFVTGLYANRINKTRIYLNGI